MVDPGELAQRIERADKGRVIARLCRISDRGGQAVAPMMPVVFAQGRVPIVEAAEQVEMARYLSADKIGYISIISCNINILHRMLCE